MLGEVLRDGGGCEQLLLEGEPELLGTCEEHRGAIPQPDAVAIALVADDSGDAKPAMDGRLAAADLGPAEVDGGSDGVRPVVAAGVAEKGSPHPAGVVGLDVRDAGRLAAGERLCHGRGGVLRRLLHLQLGRLLGLHEGARYSDSMAAEHPLAWAVPGLPEELVLRLVDDGADHLDVAGALDLGVVADTGEDVLPDRAVALALADLPGRLEGRLVDLDAVLLQRAGEGSLVLLPAVADQGRRHAGPGCPAARERREAGVGGRYARASGVTEEGAYLERRAQAEDVEEVVGQPGNVVHGERVDCQLGAEDVVRYVPGRRGMLPVLLIAARLALEVLARLDDFLPGGRAAQHAHHAHDVQVPHRGVEPLQLSTDPEGYQRPGASAVALMLRKLRRRFCIVWISSRFARISGWLRVREFTFRAFFRGLLRYRWFTFRAFFRGLFRGPRAAQDLDTASDTPVAGVGISRPRGRGVGLRLEGLVNDHLLLDDVKDLAVELGGPLSGLGGPAAELVAAFESLVAGAARADAAAERVDGRRHGREEARRLEVGQVALGVAVSE